MKKINRKSLIARIGSLCLAAVMAASAVVSAGAVAEQTTLSGDKVVRISNPDGKPGEADGYIGDREVGYGWSLAERDGYIYIGGWRNTVGVVIQHYLESALVASGKMDSETVWALTDIITNGEVPRPTNPNGGVLMKMNRENPGDFEVIAEMEDPFRHVAQYGDDLYFATYIGASGNDPKIYKLDKDDKLTEVYSTAQGSSMRANCVYNDKLYFAGTKADEKQKDGESVALAVIEKHTEDDGWDQVADYRDFSYTSLEPNAEGEMVEVQGYYGTDSFVGATAGSPFWDMTAYNGEIYCTIPNMLGYVVFRGHPAKDGEQANEYGWVWTEVVGRDKNSPNNQGFSKTDKLGFTDDASYALGYQSVVGALGTFDGKLYAYDIDHTISAELAGIQGMLMLISDPENATLAPYLKPLYTVINHAQTLWCMDAETKEFSEVEGFTALTEGTCNEYVWKHGEYNGEFYISTMDSKVIYNYLTRITGGSLAEMTPEEFERQMTYIADFVKKIAADKLTQEEIEAFVNKLLDPSGISVEDSAKLQELKEKLATTIDQIASMDKWQKLLVFGIGYLTDRGAVTEETMLLSGELQAMLEELSTLDLNDEAAVQDFITRYEEVLNALNDAAASALETLKENPESLALTEEENAALQATLAELKQAIEEIISNNFGTELAKFQDAAQALQLYTEISKIVAADDQGFDIFKTADGENWEVVTRDGFGDKFNYGALRFVTTEEGMYITTANPFYGGQLYLLSNDKGKAPEAEYVYGDADLDGTITVSDVTEIQRFIAETTQPTDLQNALADVDGDGVVTINDATMIQRYLAEMDTEGGRCGEPYQA
ncbi:MAG: hypothetical protein IJ598_13410 [Ruminococcus sp.]|nr:hypothetical protein [Ruminococcus sp.]